MTDPKTRSKGLGINSSANPVWKFLAKLVLSYCLPCPVGMDTWWNALMSPPSVCTIPQRRWEAQAVLLIKLCYSNPLDCMQSFGGSVSIMAQCIETQLMPNESSGKDLQIIYWSLLCQIAPSWRNLHHKMSMSVKLFPLQLFFLSFSWPLLGKLCASLPEKLPTRSQWNFTCILMGSVQIAVQNIIDFTDDLDLSRSQLYKITLWAIPQFLLDKLSSHFNTK